MNDFLVNVIYKNTQKIRFKNDWEEKRLRTNEIYFRKKLDSNLSKIEKTQQLIEADYRCMEKEMRKLKINKIPIEIYDDAEEIKEVDDDDNYSLTDDSSSSMATVTVLCLLLG